MSDKPMHLHLSAEQIQALLDGELPDRERRSVEEHLSACARCSAELESWGLLFSTLGELPELSPREDFGDRVMADVEVPLATPARARLGALWARRRTRAHPAVDRLQDFLEGALSGAQAARVRAHLRTCDECTRELEAWSGLMGQLNVLPRFVPSEEFADQVMAKVRVPAPATAPATVPARTRALAAARSLIPRTRRAWAAISGVAVTPAVLFGLVLYAMFSHSALTPEALASFIWWKVNGLATSAWHTMIARLLESDTLFRAYSFLDSVTRAPWALVAGLVAFSLLTGAALWILYRNLIVNSAVEGEYAHVDS